MKYVFFALIYFAFGFAFPEFPFALKVVLGFMMSVFTVLVVFNLFDDVESMEMF